MQIVRYRGKLPISKYNDFYINNKMPNVVKELGEVLDNVQQYQKDLAIDSYLQKILSNVQHWYAIEVDGDYVFAPSKFIGYTNNNHTLYYYYTRQGMDGTETEKVLNTWFKKLEKDCDLDVVLRNKLIDFVDGYDKKLNKRACIHVLK